MSNFKAKMTKFDFRWGSAPDTAGGDYSAPPDSHLYLRWPTSNKREGEERRREEKGVVREEEGREGEERG